MIVIGSGASVSYGIPSMWDLAETLKEYFKGSTFEDDKRTQVVAKFLKCLDEGMGLEDALLEVKMPQDIEQIIAIEVWKKIACADRKVYDRFVQGEIINLKSLFEYSTKAYTIAGSRSLPLFSFHKEKASHFKFSCLELRCFCFIGTTDF